MGREEEVEVRVVEVLEEVVVRVVVERRVVVEEEEEGSSSRRIALFGRFDTIASTATSRRRRRLGGVLAYALLGNSLRILAFDWPEE